MSDLFLIPCTVEGETGLSWARVGARGGKVRSGVVAAGGRAPSVADGERVTLLAPGEDVAVHDVSLPARSNSQAQAAAAFAVEDVTAQPLAEVHVCAGPAAANGLNRAIGVVGRETFASWRTLLESFRLEADQITPDFMALPCEADAAAIVDLGDRVLVRAERTGFAIEADVAGEILRGFLENVGIRSLRVWTDRLDALISPDDRARWPAQVEPAPGPQELARLFQRGLQAGAALDLSRADAEPGGGFGFEWRRWRAAAALAAVAAMGYLGLMIAQTAQFDRDRAAADAQAAQLLQEAFPDIGRVVNPRAQLRARLGDAEENGAAFLALSGLVADSVRDVASVQVDAVRFDANRAELGVAIRYTAYDDVERLAAAVDARGGVLEEGGSRRAGDSMMSDITVRAAP